MRRAVAIVVTVLTVLLLLSAPASALAPDGTASSSVAPTETVSDADETATETGGGVNETLDGDDSTVGAESTDSDVNPTSADIDPLTNDASGTDSLRTDGGDANEPSESVAENGTESLSDDATVDETTEAGAGTINESTQTVSDTVENNANSTTATHVEVTGSTNATVDANGTQTALGELRSAGGTTVGLGTQLNATVDASTLRSATANATPAAEAPAAGETPRSNETTTDDEANEGGPVSTREAGAGIAAGAGATGLALLARRIGTTAAMTSVPTGSIGSLLSTALSLFRHWGLRALALFGYQRFSDDDPLEHEARSEIYEYVRSEPGSYMSEISEETGVPLQTARYHLRVLEFESLVSRRTIRGRRRYVPVGTESPELEAALNDESTAAVLFALADHGPDSVSGLADHLERDPSTISHHLDRLADDGLVERERDGRAVVNRLPEEIEPVVDAHREIDTDVEIDGETAVSGSAD